MGGAAENRENLNLSLHKNGLSRDLPFRFWNQIHLLNGNVQRNEDREEEKEGEELQLSLGLSMNGRFGTDPTSKKLRRSSSISNLVFPVGAGSTHQTRGVAFDGHAPLGRTRSLPIEVEAACRRRRDLQSMKQMEARKKRMEKLKSVKDKDNCSEDEFVNVQRLDFGIINGSQRNSSSGFSGLQSQQIEGVKQDAEVKSHAHKDQRELPKSALPDMPYVSTNGDETGGKKIEGFLYRYRKGEDVRIVCVCHGFFLSPAEFVKHGGGGEVEHPMKHIVVNPFPFF
ncbi:hypothetical protein RD792_001451 [Penstemon davidsonii]|uniref:Ninja-family protein n=1 Tax=Penstemon davidsonii TaxID=160366 RepID=A0ABR0DP32_9LAMI|nr:hypothetical protein RD792_001451 [Penstemon davidsonii]